jgi:hypothetical protein
MYVDIFVYFVPTIVFNKPNGGALNHRERPCFLEAAETPENCSPAKSFASIS